MEIVTTLTTAMIADRTFIVAAVSCNSIELVKEKFADWLDTNGYIPYYELVIEIVDDIMFTEGSEYLKYAKVEDQTDWFMDNHNTCMDWYFMDRANEEFEKRLGNTE